MYGWINASVESLVVSKFGEDIWLQILEKAGVKTRPVWNRYDCYPDTSTLDIVSAASAVLGLDAATILEVYGGYFLHYVRDQGYDNLLRCLGSDLQTWLSNVDMLHVHLSIALPKMIAPHFRYVNEAMICWKHVLLTLFCRCDVDTDNKALILHYRSVRGPGLSPIVVGIVREVAVAYFGITVEFERLSTQGESGAESTSWKIRETGYVESEIEPDAPTVLDTIQALQSEEVGGGSGGGGSGGGVGGGGGGCPFSHGRDLNGGGFRPLEASKGSPPNSSRSRCSEADEKERDNELQEHIERVESSSLPSLPEARKPSFIQSLMRSHSGISTSSDTPTALPVKKWKLPTIFAKKTLPKSTLKVSPRVEPKLDSKRSGSHSSSFKDDIHSSRLSRKFDLATPRHGNSRKSYGLTGTQLEDVFPFHIVFDRDMKILQHGNALYEFLGTGTVIIGDRISRVCSLNAPLGLCWKNWSSFVTGCKGVSVEMVLNTKPVKGATSALALTGQILFSDSNSVATFLATPSVVKLSDMRQQGITFSHLSIYDCRSNSVLVTEHLHSETQAGQRVLMMSKELEEEKNQRLKLMKIAADEAADALATKRAFVRYVRYIIQ
jgi:hypothetical protein